MNGGGKVGLSSSLDWRFSQVFGEASAGEEVQEGFLNWFSLDLLGFLNCKMEILRRSPVVAADAFHGDEIEEENDVFFYDSESDHIQFCNNEKL
ncbi:hypothetical protein F2Q70_00030894 [Brassica cretica]|nr:hypothetical protein F2Q70_00030894 [Brassica cretica]